MTNDIQMAQQRIKNSLSGLKGLTKEITLSSAASAIVEANELLSALEVIYGALYERAESMGVINRTPRLPQPPEIRQ